MRKTIAIAIVTCLSASSAVAAENPQFEFNERIRRQTFDRIWKEFERRYPFFEVAGVDWTALREKHRPRAVGAETRSEFVHELSRMLCTLRDPHVMVVPAGRDLAVAGERWASADVRFLEIRQSLAVVEWPDGYTPQGAGRFRDDPLALPEVISVNGSGPCDPLYRTLLAGPEGTGVTLEVRWPDGSTSKETLKRERQPTEKRTWFRPPGFSTVVVGGTGYLSIESLNVPPTRFEDWVRAFQEAFGKISGTDRLILDLRNNNGGVHAPAMVVAERFVERKLKLPVERGYDALKIAPSDDRYDGRLVVLVNENTASAAEVLAALLGRHAKARIVGGPTAGAEAGIEVIRGREGTLVSAGLIPLVGDEMRFQGSGIALDVEIPLTFDRLRNGIRKGLLEVEAERIAAALDLFELDAEQKSKLTVALGLLNEDLLGPELRDGS